MAYQKVKQINILEFCLHYALMEFKKLHTYKDKSLGMRNINKLSPFTMLENKKKKSLKIPKIRSHKLKKDSYNNGQMQKGKKDKQ